MTSSLSLYNNSIVNITPISCLLDIDRIKQNPIYQCTISGGKQLFGSAIKPIQGIYNSDAPFSISLSSEYSDTFELPFADKINEVTGFAANMSNKTQFILKSLRMTEQRWTGCSNPTFNIKIDIPIIRRSDAPWSIIKYVMQATSGTKNDYTANGQVQRTESAWQIFAPNGYKIIYDTSGKDSDRPDGTYSISLGCGSTCWFRMPNALITNVECSISNKKYYDGNPTSVSVSLSFMYWRQPLFEDIVEWFPLANKLLI